MPPRWVAGACDAILLSAELCEHILYDVSTYIFCRSISSLSLCISWHNVHYNVHVSATCLEVINTRDSKYIVPKYCSALPTALHCDFLHSLLNICLSFGEGFLHLLASYQYIVQYWQGKKSKSWISSAPVAHGNAMPQPKSNSIGHIHMSRLPRHDSESQVVRNAPSKKGKQNIVVWLDEPLVQQLVGTAK